MNAQVRLTLNFNFSPYPYTILEILFDFDCVHLSVISDSSIETKIEKFHGFRELQHSTVLDDKNRCFDKNS